MKKLLAILLVAMLAVPMFAGTDILNFMWFNNKIGFAFSDRSNLPSSGAGDPYDNDGTNHNARSSGSGMPYYNFIEQFMCGMWGTAYEGNGIALKMDFFDYFSAEMEDWNSLNNNQIQLNEQIRFKGLLDVGSIYTLGLGAKGFCRIWPFDSDSGNGSKDMMGRWGFLGISLLFENAIKIPNILNINLNFEFMFVQFGDHNNWQRGGGGLLNEAHGGNPTSNNYTDLDIFMTLGLNGSYSFGFSWGLSECFILGLNLENVVGNVPSKSSGNGDEDQMPITNPANVNDGNDGMVDGTIIQNGSPQPAWFSNLPYLGTTLNLSQDVLSLAGIKDVSLKISIDELLMINCRYSGDMPEQTKYFQTEGVYGLTVGFYGFSIGLFATLATEDSYNTDLPMNGYEGSNYDEDTSPQVVGNGPRNPGRGQAGVMIKVGYSRGFFGFEFCYHGQGQFRDYDYAKDNWAAVVNNDSGLTVDNGGLFRTDNMYYRWGNQLFCSINFSW